MDLLCAQDVKRSAPEFVDAGMLQSGAERTGLYFPLLQGKKTGIVCNHSSKIGQNHLVVDSLIRAGIDLVAIFSPEHGFRGDLEAGAEFNDETDARTGIRIISLYGNKKKPDKSDLAGIDLLLFDIQDVGVRFYTYISTLAYIMEAASESGIPLIVLDRPNPNGFYVDGPVLDTNFRSFVGLHPVPVVYGMTIGEYAMMINGEGWLDGKKCDLTVIPVEGYHHNMIVALDVKPSPNLPDWKSVYLYPSVCLFEGTVLSVGRGTERPFQVIGHPEYMSGSYSFTPRRIPSVAEKPPFEGQTCYGMDLSAYAENYRENEAQLNISWIIGMYEYFKGKDFFNSYFDKLAGNKTLRNDVINGKTEAEIRSSWQEELAGFMEIRKKYLIYPE